MSNKYILVLLHVFSASYLAAQPVLTSDEMPPIGSVFTRDYVENPGIYLDTTIQGADVTWDFANLEPDPQTDGPYTYTVRDITDPALEFAADFPEANWVLDGETFQDFIQLTPSAFTRLGYSDVTSWVEPDPLNLLCFPLGTNTECTDTYGTNCWYTTTTIGYGTLLFPDGMVHTDVLFMRIRLITQEFGQPSTSYSWYSSTTGVELLRYRVPNIAIRLLDYTNAVSENETALADYTNPVTEEFSFTLRGASSTVNVEVYDLQGKLIRQQVVVLSDRRRGQLPMSAVAPGLYSVIVRPPGQSPIALRVVKS